jgi:hypothetical protein
MRTTGAGWGERLLVEVLSEGLLVLSEKAL